MKRILVLVLSLTFLTQCGNKNDQSKSSTNAAGQGNSNQLGGTNGQTVRWDKNSISFSVPAEWARDNSLSQEGEKRSDKTFDGLVWRGPQDQRIELNVETSDTDFPASAEDVLAADFKSNKSGPVKLADLRYLEVNGVKGLYYRMPNEDTVNANWLASRHYKSKAQSIHVNLAGPRKELEHLNNILSSVKLDNQERR